MNYELVTITRIICHSCLSLPRLLTRVCGEESSWKGFCHNYFIFPYSTLLWWRELSKSLSLSGKVCLSPHDDYKLVRRTIKTISSHFSAGRLRALKSAYGTLLKCLSRSQHFFIFFSSLFSSISCQVRLKVVWKESFSCQALVLTLFLFPERSSLPKYTWAKSFYAEGSIFILRRRQKNTKFISSLLLTWLNIWDGDSSWVLYTGHSSGECRDLRA